MTIDPLAQKTAWIIGGGRGIGQEIAIDLARHDVTVAVSARTHGEINHVVQEIKAAGGNAAAIPLDISNVEAVQDAVVAIEAVFAPIDILIITAAIVGEVAPLWKTNIAEWITTQEVNVMGSYYPMRAVLPGMVERGWGRIHLYTSGAAQGSGIPKFSAYSVSKAAVDMLARSAALDVAGTSVTINLISPGMVDTSMQGDVRRKPQTDDNRATLQYFHDAHHNKQLTNPVAAARQSVAMLYGDMNGETIHLYNLTAAQQDLVDKHISHLD